MPSRPGEVWNAIWSNVIQPDGQLCAEDSRAVTLYSDTHNMTATRFDCLNGGTILCRRWSEQPFGPLQMEVFVSMPTRLKQETVSRRVREILRKSGFTPREPEHTL
jgi:hypothetical protein